MVKQYHEIRDPLHAFIRFDSDERNVLNSRPFQRLRQIHQLAVTFLVYPGATHRRFEHSLGVMELAGKVFDVVTDRQRNKVLPEVKETIDEIARDDERVYWRKVLRMAALCHDIGHLPFSHASESLLPKGWNHERLTVEIIRSQEMEQIWQKMTPPLRADDVAKVAIGKKLARFDKNAILTNWQSILSEVIVGDAFGVDRMDYLLRDSHHAGVAYGKFDHFRLIDTLKILPKTEDGSIEPALGIEEGGLQTAESLLLARYYMFSQLYFHPIRLVYDFHLQNFMKELFKGKTFPTKLEEFLNYTDNEIMSEISKASRRKGSPGYDHAVRILNRGHFRLLYTGNPIDRKSNLNSTSLIFMAAKRRFGSEAVYFVREASDGGGTSFPVELKDGRVENSLSLSQSIEKMQPILAEFVYIRPDLREEATVWIEDNRERILNN